MRKWLKVLVPSKIAGRRFMQLGAVAGVMALAFYCGRWGAPAQATANPPEPGVDAGLPSNPAEYAGSDYGRRPVAYIYGNVPVTREDLGEYLIARFGPQRIDLLVNRRIIERACQARGIQVTDAEVEAQLVEDLASMKIGRLEDFENVVLKRFNKTLFEYKEDAIRPKLALAKLCRPNVHVEEEDLQKAFEAHYGPKVHCRMIILQKEMKKHEKDVIWEKVSSSEKEFDSQASSQFVKELAAHGGDVPPIFKHFGSEPVEKVAFNLKVGQVSQLIDMPDGTTIILKCVEHLPPDTTHRFEDERLKLHREVTEVKMGQEIPRFFQKLRAAADPKVFLKREATPEEQMMRGRVDRLLRAAVPQAAAMPPPPAGLADTGKAN